MSNDQRDLVSTVCEVAGALMLVAGVFVLFGVAAALIVGGLFALAAGYLLGGMR